MISVSKSLNAILRLCTHVSKRRSQCWMCHSELLSAYVILWSCLACWYSILRLTVTLQGQKQFYQLQYISCCVRDVLGPSVCFSMLAESWPLQWELPFLVVSARSPISDPDWDIPIDSTCCHVTSCYMSHHKSWDCVFPQWLHHFLLEADGRCLAQQYESPLSLGYSHLYKIPIVSKVLHILSLPSLQFSNRGTATKTLLLAWTYQTKFKDHPFGQTNFIIYYYYLYLLH